MGTESDIITILCVDLSDKHKPLTRAEFWKFYHQYGSSAKELSVAEDDRIIDLMKRTGSIAFGKDRLEQLGIKIVTFVDDGFPRRLKEKLGKFCPPLLYVSGDMKILRHKFVGYVGSRSIDEADIVWTENRLRKNLADGFGVVTGGANGIDSVAMHYALQHGAPVVVFLPDNIKEKLRDPFVRQHIWNGNLLVISHISPFAKKMRSSFVAAAMERNKYIYALSNGTAVVRSDLNKGGTWTGAADALKHGWAQVFVWDNRNYPGNQKLIDLGAQALSAEGKRMDGKTRGASRCEKHAVADGHQISLFATN